MIKRKKTLELIANIGLAMVFLMSNTGFILALASGAKLTGSEHSFTLLVGYSMTPTIKHGDTALIKKGIEDIQVGDIISFKVKSLPIGVIHRVIKIEKNPSLIIHTKGDANELPDGWEITTEQLRGKVVHIIPTSLLFTPYILLPSILLPAGLILIRIAYCRFKRNLTTEGSKPRILNLTTVILLMILAHSGGRVLDLAILSLFY